MNMAGMFMATVAASTVIQSAPIAALSYTLNISGGAIDSALTDFPVLIHIGAQSGTGDLDTRAIFTEVGAASGKISVQLLDGTELDTEVELWDTAAQEGYLWTKVPYVSAGTNTPLKLLYGSSRAVSSKVYDTSTAGVSNVWTNSYVAVNHLNGSGDTLDSKSRITYSNVNTPTYNLSSVIAGGKTFTGGAAFDGVDDMFKSSLSITTELYEASWSAWMKSSVTFSEAGYNLINMQSQAGTCYLISMILARYSSIDSNRYIIYTQQWNYPRTGYGISQNTFGTNPGHNMCDGNWHHVVMVRSSNADNYVKMYIDGKIATQCSALVGTTNSPNVSGTLATGSMGPLSFVNSSLGVAGAHYSGGSFPGSLDEVRLQQAARSAEWIKAEYNTGIDNLITFS